MSINLAHPYFLYATLPLVALAAYWRWKHYKRPLYRYSSLAFVESTGESTEWRSKIIFLARLLTLLTLALAIGRIQKPDERSKIPVQGVDIMLVLDVSGSMQIIDDIDDPRPRIDAAIHEAMKFVEKRDNDPIGLVIFGSVAVSRAPLTMDKNVLKEILKDTKLGIVDPEGTVLSRAILTAANRLKKSTAKSKIMIVLTDGEPSGHDINPQVSIDLAKKLGIKIYTIGIGNEQGGWIKHPYLGPLQVRSTLNVPLLKAFANETGGQFFHAQNPADMEKIYATIDQLERTEHEVPLFARYFDYFMPLLWIAFILLLAEIVLTSIFWLSL